MPWALPATHKLGGQGWGALDSGAVLTSEPGSAPLQYVALRQIERELERQVADRTSQLAAANAALQAQVDQLIGERQTLQGALRASDHERRLAAYELHDGVSQQLLGAKLLFESHRRSLGSAFPHTGTDYELGMAALLRAAAEIRNLMSGRRTPVLDREGLVAAIAELATQLGSVPGAPAIEFYHAVRFVRLEPILENSLFRIAQEGLNNACRHSGSDAVRVRLVQEADTLSLEVQDWGSGFDPAAIRLDRFGLESLRERSQLLAGQLRIESRPNQGTRICARFPLE